MDWEDLFETVDSWAVRAAAPSWDLRKHAVDVYTSSPVGYYFNPLTERVALYGNGDAPADMARCKQAAARALGADTMADDLALTSLAEQPWVKIAYSQTLRRIGEYLNFFPGQYPGGIPNAPSPLAALLTTGLVGAGLGWGAGRLAKKLLPEGYGENLGRTGAIVGGLLGSAVPAAWGAVNLAHGKSLLDGQPLNTPPDAEPVPDTHWMDGTNAGPIPPHARNPLDRYLEGIHVPAPLRRKVGSVILNDRYEGAIKQAFGDTMGGWAAPRPATPSDVNVNALGQTLWQLGAQPNLATTTMGALYAAQQLPDPYARPGWATGHQLGQLSEGMGGAYGTGPMVGMALNAAKDYFQGLAGGAIINAAIGTPFRASTFGLGNAALGVIGTIVPRLFGG